MCTYKVLILECNRKSVHLAEGVQSEEMNADRQYELMKQKRDKNETFPTCISSVSFSPPISELICPDR